MSFKLEIYGELDVEDGIALIGKKNLKIKFNGREINLKNLGFHIDRQNIWTLIEFQVRKIIEWIKKAETEKDGYNRFFSLWVAFNTFYNLISNKQSERERILETLETLNDSEKKILFKMLKEDIRHWLKPRYILKLKIQGEYKRVNKELIERLEQNDYEESLKCLMKCLYATRCNLFHGEKSIDDEVQNMLLEKAYGILRKMFSILLVKFLINPKIIID
ncbi:MAG: hypothetical protein ACP6IQ_07500 [Candidatus Njordarchaeia archaeon]